MWLKRIHRTLAITIGLLTATPALAQPAWEAPPRLDGLPTAFRGFPKHGEFMAAGVACGRRGPEWERRYRAAVERAAAQRASSSEEAEAVIRHVEAYAAYARRRVAVNRGGYCGWTANPVDLAGADAIIAGRDQVR